MPNKHFYFALGAAHGTAVVAWIHHRRHVWYERYRWVRALYRWDRDWFLYFPLVIGTFGFLALLPDILYAIGVLTKAQIRTPWFNVFYGYAWFEQIEDARPSLDWAFNSLGSALLYMQAIAILQYYSGMVSRRLNTIPLYISVAAVRNMR